MKIIAYLRMALRLKLCLNVILIIFTMQGCSTPELDKAVGEMMNDNMMLPAVVSMYYVKNNRWPTSQQDIEKFCAESKNECPAIDWSKFTSVSFEPLPDGKLKYESIWSASKNASAGNLKLSGTLDIPKKN